MQYVLTEAEHKANVQIRGQRDFFQHRVGVLEKQIDSEKESPAIKMLQKKIAKLNKENEALEQENRNVRASVRSRTINLGTYPIPIAQQIVDGLRKVRDNDKVQTLKFRKVKQKGRGPRVVDGVRIGTQSDIALDKAQGAAVYIEL